MSERVLVLSKPLKRDRQVDLRDANVRVLATESLFLQPQRTLIERALTVPSPSSSSTQPQIIQQPRTQEIMTAQSRQDCLRGLGPAMSLFELAFEVADGVHQVRSNFSADFIMAGGLGYVPQ